MILGIDPSTLNENRACGSRYFVHGVEVDPLTYMHEHNGVNLMRLRIWVDPHDDNGTSYGGGTNGLKETIALAKEGLEKGYQLLLDFHYSDFWCDPAKQWMPKSWVGLGLDELVEKVYQYTLETLKSLQNEGISLKAIQIGNEITNGMLWPFGKLESKGSPIRDGYDSLIRLINAGIKAAREVYPESSILLHLERSGDQYIYREFFDEMEKNHVDYDIIGMSYYPYWHGTFEMLSANIDMVKERYHKPVWIVETAYGFTYEDYLKDDELFIPWVNARLLEDESTYHILPLSKDGQKEFVEKLIELSLSHGVEAICYWEPFWLPRKGLYWASKCGEEYVKETVKPINNEWANQCLFDYEGEATPAFYSYKI